MRILAAFMLSKVKSDTGTYEVGVGLRFIEACKRVHSIQANIHKPILLSKNTPSTEPGPSRGLPSSLVNTPATRASIPACFKKMPM